MHVPRGTEVVNYIEMLAEHFDCVGSPIMIGRKCVYVCVCVCVCDVCV